MQTALLFRPRALHRTLVFMLLFYCLVLWVIAHMLLDYADPSLKQYDISKANTTKT